jgi:hypothetical protein
MVCGVWCGLGSAETARGWRLVVGIQGCASQKSKPQAQKRPNGLILLLLSMASMAVATHGGAVRLWACVLRGTDIRTALLGRGRCWSSKPPPKRAAPPGGLRQAGGAAARLLVLPPPGPAVLGGPGPKPKQPRLTAHTLATCARGAREAPRPLLFWRPRAKTAEASPCKPPVHGAAWCRMGPHLGRVGINPRDPRPTAHGPRRSTRS